MSTRAAVLTAMLVALAVAGATSSVAPAVASSDPRGAMDGAAGAFPFTREDWIAIAAVALLLAGTHVFVRMAVRRVRGAEGG